MGRKKVNMERITEEKKRNTTYRNRKNGIIKKAKELSVLCDVDTAIIIYPPGSNQPEIWPQDPHHIKNMIRSYKEEKNDNRKRTYGLNDYFQDRKRKVEEELVRARERNLEAKYPTWFDDLNGLSVGQLRQLATELEKKKNNAKAVLERKKRELIENNQPSSSHSVVGSLDQVEAFNHVDLMSQLLDDMPDLQMPFENKQPSNQYVGSYPVFGCDVVYDNSNPFPCQPLQQCGPMPEGQPTQFAIGLENKKNTVNSHLERKKRKFNVQTLSSSGFKFENHQPYNHSVGSYPSLDQVQAFNHDVMSQVPEWFNDMPDLQMPFGFGFELENNQPSNPYVGSYASLDQGGLMMSHNLGWFNDAATTSTLPINPLNPEVDGFGYPVFEGDVVYDNSKPCPCQPLEQCGPIPEELALQDSHDGFGDGFNFS